MNDKQITSVLFVSRNKDNKHIEDFKQRSKSFVTTKTVHDLRLDFARFVNQGLPNEFSRMYISVNSRSNNKTQKALMHKLIDGDVDMYRLPQIVASIASHKENVYDSKNMKWLFDYDLDDLTLKNRIDEFVTDINTYYKTNTKSNDDINIEIHKTPNGFAIIVDKRFDTRELLQKWKNVELKRDAYLCIAWAHNNQNGG